MTRRDCLGLLADAALPAQTKPPNVVLIVSDDHGYGDSSCYDHPAEVRTPNIDRIARRGVRFVCGYASAYVCAPMQAPDADIRKHDTGNRNRDIYLGMLGRMDLAVGAVLDALERRGLDRDTLVFFFSDNGGARQNSASNGALRDYKHSVYEGGIRVPFLFSWPARVPQGTVSREPVISMDIFATICAAAGAELPKDRIIDGKNLLGKGALHEALY